MKLIKYLPGTVPKTKPAALKHAHANPAQPEKWKKKMKFSEKMNFRNNYLEKKMSKEMTYQHNKCLKQWDRR